MATRNLEQAHNVILSLLDNACKAIHVEECKPPEGPKVPKPSDKSFEDIAEEMSDVISEKKIQVMVHQPPAETTIGPAPAPSPAPAPGPKPEDEWGVTGKVTDEKGTGIGGVTVTLFDRDLLFSDRLGSTSTDLSGNFEIKYKTADFSDLFDEKPDIYLVILKDNKPLCTTKTIYTAGRVETINVTIPCKKRGEKSG